MSHTWKPAKNESDVGPRDRDDAPAELKYKPLGMLQEKTKELEEKVKKMNMTDLKRKHVDLVSKINLVTKVLQEAEKDGLDIGDDALSSDCVRMWLKEIVDTICEMFQHIRLLELVAVQCHPSAVCIVLRRHLEDGRFCVTDGFVAVFPNFFDKWTVLNPFDLTGRTSDWYAFKDRLYQHVDSHIVEKAGGLEQRESFFRDCNHSQLLFVGNNFEASDSNSRRNDLPEVNRFEYSEYSERRFPELRKQPLYMMFADDADLRRRTVRDEEPDLDTDREEEAIKKILKDKDNPKIYPRDPYLYAQFRSYIPVFIWAYNTLKMGIFRDDDKIVVLKKDVIKFENALRELTDRAPAAEEERKPGPPDDESAFTLGTAANLCKREDWLEFLDNNFGLCGRTPESLIAAERESRSEESSAKKQKTAAAEPEQGPSGVPSGANKGAEAKSNLAEKDATVLRANAEADLKRAWARHELANRRRENRFERFQSVAKCLAILLDVSLLNYTIFGKGFCRMADNYIVHLPNREQNPELIRDALNNIQPIVNKFVEERRALREKRKQREEQLESASELPTLLRKRDRLQKRGRSSDEESEDGVREYMRRQKGETKPSQNTKGKASTSKAIEDKGEERDWVDEDEDERLNRLSDGRFELDVVGDTTRLANIIYDRHGYFDKGTDRLIEKNVDAYLERVCKDSLAVDKYGNWAQGINDQHLLVAWLNSCFPVEMKRH